MQKKLLTIGDSHSATGWGKSWPDFLSKKLNYSLLRAASPGAGNSYYIEKLHQGLKEYKPDLVVIQLTDPSRIVTGLNSIGEGSTASEFESGVVFRDIECYTWNGGNNEKNLKIISNEDVKIDRLWTRYITTSKWVDYKVMQDLAYMYFLCSFFKTDVIFFSWFVDFRKLFLENYSWLKNEIKWIEGFAWQEILDRDFPPFSPDDWHYGSEPHKVLVDEWLYPNITTKLTYL